MDYKGEVVADDLDSAAVGDLTLGVAPNQYSLPSNDGSANQVLVTDGSGSLTFQDQTGGATFDQTLNKADAVQFRELYVSSTRINLGNPYTTGYVLPLTNGTAGQVLTATSDEYTEFKDPVLPFDQTLNTSDNVAFNQVVSQGAVIVGSANGATTYALPETRGADGQVLVAKGNGFPLWEDAAPEFDQSLNQGDDVVFNSLATKKRKLVDGLQQSVWEDELVGGKDYTIKKLGVNAGDVLTLQQDNKRVKIGNSSDVWGIDTQMVEYGNGLQPRYRTEVIPDGGGVNADLVTTNINALAEESKAVSLWGSSKQAVMGPGWTNRTEGLSVAGDIPSLADLNAGEWDFSTSTPTNLISQGVAPNEVVFATTTGLRAINSLQYIIPSKMSVGSFVRWDCTCTVGSGNNISIGCNFKDSQTKYEGFGTGFGAGENYVIVQSSGNITVQGGAVLGTANANINRGPGAYAVQITRTSSTLWSITFVTRSLSVTTPAPTFGPEFQDKKLFLWLGDMAAPNSSITMTIDSFTETGYGVSPYNYTLKHNDSNELIMTTPSDIPIMTVSANATTVTTPLQVAGNVCVLGGRYGYGCCVESTLYKMSVSANTDIINSTVSAQLGIQSPFIEFGAAILPPPLNPGQAYKINMSGRLGTGNSDTFVKFDIYLGNVLIGTSNPANNAIKKDQIGSYWNLEAEIVPWATFFATNETFVRCDGLFTYNDNSVNGQKNVGGTAIVSTTYDTSAAVATRVDTQSAHPVRVFAQLGEASLIDYIIVDNYYITQSAFNQ